MIVCAAPRSGGTVFCIELAQKMGIPFEGEFNVLHARELREGTSLPTKAEVHETQFQPDYDMKGFFKHAEQLFSPAHLYLINHQVQAFLPHAKTILVRRNIRAALSSMANLVLLNSPADNSLTDIQARWLNTLVSEQARTFWMIKMFCKARQTTPMFYEDLYTGRDHYPALEASPARFLVEAVIEKRLRRWGLEAGF